MSRCRLKELIWRVKRHKSKRCKYTLKDSEALEAAKADVKAGKRVSTTLDRLERLYGEFQQEIPTDLTREIGRMARAAAVQRAADATAPSGATATATATALKRGAPAKKERVKPSTGAPQQPKRARAEAAAGAGDTQRKRARTAAAAAGGAGSSTQPEAAPLQLSDPPTLQELLDCQAVMGFGTHAKDADLCAEERQAYAAKMPYGGRTKQLLTRVPNHSIDSKNYVASNYWTTVDSREQTSLNKAELLRDLILVGRVKVLLCPWGNPAMAVETTGEGGGGGSGSGRGGNGGSCGGGGSSSIGSSKERSLVASYLANIMCSQPPQTFEPPTTQQLIDRQAAMRFGTHASSTKLCEEEGKAYKATVGFGRYRSVLLSRVPEDYMNWMVDQQGSFWDASERKLQLLRDLLLVGRMRVARDPEDEGRLVVRTAQPDRAAAAGGSGGGHGGSGSGGGGVSGGTNSWRRMELATRLAIAVVNQQEGAVPMEERPRGQKEPVVAAGWFAGWKVREVPTAYVGYVCDQCNEDHKYILENRRLVEALLATRRVMRVGGALVATGVPAKRRPNWTFKDGKAVQERVVFKGA